MKEGASMQVREIMSKDVKLVDSSVAIADAATMMRDGNIGALPVGESGRLTGMITDRDLVVRGMAEAKDPNLTTVREVMTPQFLFVFEDQSVEEVGTFMAEHQIRRVPVLDREQRLVGMVSIGDLSQQAAEGVSSDVVKAVTEPGGKHAN
jgi:CBS domain-containing protein